MLWCERVPPIVGCLRAGPQLAQGTLLHARSRRGAVSGAGARAGASGSTRSLVEPRSVEDVTLVTCVFACSHAQGHGTRREGEARLGSGRRGTGPHVQKPHPETNASASSGPVMGPVINECHPMVSFILPAPSSTVDESCCLLHERYPTLGMSASVSARALETLAASVRCLTLSYFLLCPLASRWM